MSLEDDLSGIVKSKQETLEEAWTKKRKVVRSRFARTANRLNDEDDAFGSWSVGRVNGSIALRVRNGKVYTLLFSKDESARQVICEATVSRPDSSSVDDPFEGYKGESFDIDKLTESEVDRKITEFIATFSGR